MYSAYKSLGCGLERDCQICPSAYERRAGAWAKCSGSTVLSYVALRFRLYKVEFSSVQFSTYELYIRLLSLSPPLSLAAGMGYSPCPTGH